MTIDLVHTHQHKYTIKGYADDLKPLIRSMEEFLMVDAIITIYEKASACALHRDPSSDKCKVLLLGGWKKLKQTDIPLNYIKISNHLDMLGFTLMSTFTKTRKTNGDVLQIKVKNTVGPWKGGRSLSLTERSPSLNTYCLPKVWFRCHMMELRNADINFVDKQASSWLYAGQLEKPANFIKYRSKSEGGLQLHHVKSKSMAILVKTFLETASQNNFLTSTYHQALLNWHVYNEKSVPDPGNTPYYSVEFFNIIKDAWNKDMSISTMKTKDWYSFILRPIIYDLASDSLIQCKAELANPLNDWPTSWRLARLNGLSSESSTFLWQLLHQILPTRDRLHKILPTVQSATCISCDLDQIGNIRHSLVICSASRDAFNWMMTGLKKFSIDLTIEKVLLLDIQPRSHLPFNNLPLLWFTAEVLRRIWNNCRDGKKSRLYLIRSELEAEVNLVRQSKYSDMSTILDLMME